MILATDHYDSDGILTRIPHRFENVLLDHVNCIKTDVDTRGEFSVTFTPDQPRALFLQEIEDGKFGVIRTALMEILALASIVCTDYPDDGIIIFASISNFIVKGDLPEGTALTGEVVKLKDKGNFVRCRGHIGTATNPQLASGELMAFVISKAQLADHSSAPKIVDIPTLTHDIPIDPSAFNKAPEMVVCDQLRKPYSDGTVIGQYRYPSTHPLTKGHFPGNPIMMGIMQMLAIEDLCAVAFSQEPAAIGKMVAGQCQIIRTDGALIAEIKNFEVEIKADRAAFSATKKVVFRESIRPEDTVLIYLYDITIT
jgi:3-hydroxymyristoyl/3-hydroxydecanoyl-(acyl carrier protein) dehydratase